MPSELATTPEPDHRYRSDATFPDVMPGPVDEILPTKRRVTLHALVASFSMVRVLAVRDLKATYKQAALGPIWLLIQPLATLVAFTVVFAGVTEVDTSGVPYPLFGLTGLCVWSFFQLALSRGVGSIVANQSLVRRVHAPRVAFPIASLVIQFPVLAATLVLTLVGAYTIGDGLPLRAVLLPVGIVWLVVVTWALVSLISALAVRFRDFYAAVPLMLQAGIFLTPVGYPASDASPAVASLLAINPLTGLVEFWRWCLLAGSEVQTFAIAVSIPVTLTLTFVSWFTFGRLEVKFADYV